ncbi:MULTISPECIES: DUF2939 domain-containing protein [unclassified Bradyrhizobium]|uniref:DUF2939 domain-containing protein n=1 Tax=unclassified Bradyrhizobium TaxID=2631580 RepID=UPI001FF79D1F|nr:MULTISPECIES: DUF2939 domain-containing protein [unclassified Bradyrhizobium]
MKWLIGVVLAVLVCVGIYGGSAFVSLVGLVSAVRGADVAQILARTDMPRLRHSIVDQVMTAYLDRLGQKRQLRPIERIAINAFGATIADDLAAKLMTSENLSVLLKSGAVRNATEDITFGTMSSVAELDISSIFALAGRITFVKPLSLHCGLEEARRQAASACILKGQLGSSLESGCHPRFSPTSWTDSRRDEACDEALSESRSGGRWTSPSRSPWHPASIRSAAPTASADPPQWPGCPSRPMRCTAEIPCWHSGRRHRADLSLDLIPLR